jgi:glycosyltransferase involved in cell wall biosynthesis
MKDIVVFSHLRWDFVFQRPQHIMTGLAANYRIIFIEEELISENEDRYTIKNVASNIWVIQSYLQDRNHINSTQSRMRAVLDTILDELAITDYIAWYYTPMSYAFSNHLQPVVIVYDCMDELSAFLHAPPELINNEIELLKAADLVFTGGVSLYEVKKDLHSAVYCLPSSIDKKHFIKARDPVAEPADQIGIAFPRFGFFGVIDERFDSRLIKEVAEARPEWQFILIGPVVKIDASSLPKLPNIHYLGIKNYKELPAYLSSWQITFLPFAMNESTRFISPTKTPEYLSAGKPVISTPVRDVVRTYGERELVSIVRDSAEFITAGEKLLEQSDKEWLRSVDEFLQTMSWANTVKEINEHLQSALVNKQEMV